MDKLQGTGRWDDRMCPSNGPFCSPYFTTKNGSDFLQTNQRLVWVLRYHIRRVPAVRHCNTFCGHSHLPPFAPAMVRKRFQDAKTGLSLAKSFDAQKFLKKIGLGKEDYHFWKQVGKALLCTYTLFGVAWLYNETSPLGWWTLKPRPKEERELAHLYERRRFPYPGDEEAMEEFVAKGGMIGTTIGPKGIIETDKDSLNYQKQLQDQKLEQEALKLWLRMRNEVILELQEKGFDAE